MILLKEGVGKIKESVSILSNFILFLLVIVCIFDPYNMIVHLKYPLFSAFLLLRLALNRHLKFNSGLLIYILIFTLLIPAISVYIALLFNMAEFVPPPLSIQYWAGFLFLILTLFVYEDDAYFIFKNSIIFSLTLLSFWVIAIALVTYMVNGNLYYEISHFGFRNQLFWLSQRNYSGVTFPMIYYTSSPLLVVSYSYWIFRGLRHFSKLNYFFVFVVGLALFLSGTRNNMLLAIAVPFFIWLFYGKYKMWIAFSGLTIGTFLIVKYNSVFSAIFDVTDYSNTTKLASIKDYWDMLSHSLQNILFGQGIGSYFWSAARYQYVSTTELSFFELIRMFGLVFGIVMILMYVAPLFFLKKSNGFTSRYLFVAYLFYLGISMLNPYIFASNGMLMLSFVLATIFNERRVVAENKF